MTIQRRLLVALTALATVTLCAPLSGCAVLMVADAATSIAVGAVKATVGVAGAVVDVATPSSNDDRD